MASKAIEILIRAKNLASSVFKTVGKDAQDAGNEAGSTAGKGFFYSMNRAGRRSEFTNALRLMNGAGAAAGITLAGRALSDMVEKANQLSKSWAQGKEDWASITQSILESAPLVGGFAKAGKGLKEYDFFNPRKGSRGILLGLTDKMGLTDDARQSDVDEANRAAEAQNAATDGIEARRKAMKKLREDWGKEDLTIRFKAALVGKEGFARDIQQMQNDGAKALNDASDKTAQELQQLEDTSKGTIEHLRKLKDQAESPEEQQDISEKIKREQANLEKNKAEIVANGEKNTAAIRQQNALEIGDFVAKHERDLQNELRGIDVQTNAARLAASKDFLNADLSQLDEELQAKLDAVDKELTGEEAAKKKAALRAESDAKRSLIEQNVLEQNKLKILQALGSYGNAEAAQQAATIQRVNEETEARKRLKAIIDDTHATKAQKDEAKNQLKQMDDENKARIQSQLKDMNTAALEAQQQFGSTQRQRDDAQKRLEKQKIMDEAKERRAALNAILKDANASTSQKLQAQKAFDTWAKQQGKRFDDETNNVKGGKPLATLEQGHFITGLQQRASARDDKEMRHIKLSEDANKLMQQLGVKLDAIAGKFDKAQVLKVGSTGAYGP